MSSDPTPTEDPPSSTSNTPTDATEATIPTETEQTSEAPTDTSTEPPTEPSTDLLAVIITNLGAIDEQLDVMIARIVEDTSQSISIPKSTDAYLKPITSFSSDEKPRQKRETGTPRIDSAQEVVDLKDEVESIVQEIDVTAVTEDDVTDTSAAIDDLAAANIWLEQDEGNSQAVVELERHFVAELMDVQDLTEEKQEVKSGS